MYLSWYDKPWASLFTVHCSSSLSCMNECLATDSGYLCMSLHQIAVWLDASQRSWDDIQLNCSVREDGVKCLDHSWWLDTALYKNLNLPLKQIPWVIGMGVTYVERSGKDLDSQLREPRFESCAALLKPWANCFTLHCYSSLSCINEYLAIDIGGYVYKQPSRINCSIWLDASQRSWDGVWVNRSVREVKCKVHRAVLRTGYCAI